jgi:hypothetical protein
MVSMEIIKGIKTQDFKTKEVKATGRGDHGF